MQISREERDLGRWNPENLKQAVGHFKEHGYVVLEDMLPKDFLAELLPVFNNALNAKILRSKFRKVDYYDDRGKFNNDVLIDFRPEGGNHDLNRWNMHLPSIQPFLAPAIFANPFAVAIIDSILGEDSVANIIAADIPFPGSGYQNIHQDWHEPKITINIPLIDYTEDNGPIEVWPGTHKQDLNGEFSLGPHFISPEGIKEIAKTVPSKRMLLTAGSFLIRDHRLVHRGTANRSNAPRPTLSIYYKKPQAVLPYSLLQNSFSRLARYFRKRGEGCEDGSWRQRALVTGKLINIHTEDFYNSDRDYRRRVPLAIWRSFTPLAKRLLRYAQVEKHGNEMPQGDRSFKLTLSLFFMLFSVIQGHMLSRKK